MTVLSSTVIGTSLFCVSMYRRVVREYFGILENVRQKVDIYLRFRIETLYRYFNSGALGILFKNIFQKSYL